jgi:hypothetical protein
MLFDLRGRGRRRTVQGIYLFLAILLGVGLVGFGIGGGFGGTGVINALTGNSGSSGETFTGQVAKDQKAANAQPNNPVLWAKLVNDLFREAGSGSNYNSNVGAFTNQSRPTLNQLATAWQHYLAINKTPSPTLAELMVQIYGPTNNALNQPSNALAAQQIVFDAKANPTYTDYQALAIYAYLAKNLRVGNLAAAKAIHTAPVAQQAQLRTELKALRANPSALAQAEQQAQQAASGPQTFSVPSTAPTAANTATATATSATASAPATKK